MGPADFLAGVLVNVLVWWDVLVSVLASVAFTWFLVGQDCCPGHWQGHPTIQGHCQGHLPGHPRFPYTLQGLFKIRATTQIGCKDFARTLQGLLENRLQGLYKDFSRTLIQTGKVTLQRPCGP